LFSSNSVRVVVVVGNENYTERERRKKKNENGGRTKEKKRMKIGIKENKERRAKAVLPRTHTQGCLRSCLFDGYDGRTRSELALTSFSFPTQIESLSPPGAAGAAV